MIPPDEPATVPRNAEGLTVKPAHDDRCEAGCDLQSYAPVTVRSRRARSVRYLKTPPASAPDRDSATIDELRPHVNTVLVIISFPDTFLGLD